MNLSAVLAFKIFHLHSLDIWILNKSGMKYVLREKGRKLGPAFFENIRLVHCTCTLRFHTSVSVVSIDARVLSDKIYGKYLSKTLFAEDLVCLVVNYRLSSQLHRHLPG